MGEIGVLIYQVIKALQKLDIDKGIDTEVFVKLKTIFLWISVYFFTFAVASNLKLKVQAEYFALLSLYFIYKISMKDKTTLKAAFPSGFNLLTQSTIRICAGGQCYMLSVQAIQANLATFGIALNYLSWFFTPLSLLLLLYSLYQIYLIDRSKTTFKVALIASIALLLS